MRTILKCMLLPISLWAACTGSKQVKDFIPGIYVGHAESAYSIADDTLVIASDPHGSGIYQVTRRTTFWRKEDNQTEPPQHKVKNYTAVWDKDKQTLQITQNGTILLFQPEQHSLRVENSDYRKL